MDNESSEIVTFKKNSIDNNDECAVSKNNQVMTEGVNNISSETKEVCCDTKEIDTSAICEIKGNELVTMEETNIVAVTPVKNQNCDHKENETPVIEETVVDITMDEVDILCLPQENTNTKSNDTEVEVVNNISENNVNKSDINRCKTNLIDKENSIEVVNINSDKTNSKKTDLFFIDNRSSLDAIALQYDSSDSDAENTKKNKNNADVSNAQIYRNKDEVVLLSDDSSEDSDSDSSSSSDNNSVHSKSHNKEDSDDSDDENQKTNKGNRIRKKGPKGEFDDLPPIEDLKISVPEVLCDPLGKVAWTVEQMVVVRPEPGKPTLNLDTVLFIEKGKRALGHIFDVFGQVTEPHYCVRFNSSDHIRESDIKVGMTVYYCPNTQYTSLVFLSELKKMKPLDDLEEDDPPQFSDDEEERLYLASLKNKSNKTQEISKEVPNKRRRGNKQGWQSNHPWNSFKGQQQQQNQSPFYRTHHPWSRPRYQQNYNNPWYQPPQQQCPYNWTPPNYHPPTFGNPQQAYPQYAYTNQRQPEQYQAQQPVAYATGNPNNYVQLPHSSGVQQAAGFAGGEQNASIQSPQSNIIQLQGTHLITQFPLIPPPPPPPPTSESNKD